MQQFTVPQFIDVEDKIIGPVTTRQFIIMLTGFLFIAISYKLFDFSLFLTLGILIFAISGVVSFFKINGMPFHYFILNFTQTLRKPNLRVWNNIIGRIEGKYEEENKKVLQEISQPKAKSYSTSRLTELSLIVDTQGAYKGENDEEDKGAYELSREEGGVNR